MSDEIKDISDSGNGNLDNRQLLDYLGRKLSKEEAHDVEKLMAEDDFVNDAVEGLQEFKSTASVDGYVQQLNDSLKKQLEKKKARKEKRRLEGQPWIQFAAVLLLLLCIIAYVVIKYTHRQKNQPPAAPPKTISLIETKRALLL